MFKLSLFILFLQSTNSISGQMQCRDESGKVVDWYVVYKFPRIAGQTHPFDTGYKYAFITSADQNSGWTLSEEAITNGKKSIFGQTLQSLYESKLDPRISFINYNDQAPNENVTHTGGHNKGIVAIDDIQGFWITHSIPVFPSNESTHSYYYPYDSGRYGQTALCISIKLSEFDIIVEQLLYMRPNIYAINVSNDLLKSSVNIKDLMNGKWSSEKLSIKGIKSSGGITFTNFAKSQFDQVDIYSAIVAPELNVSLYAETWRNDNYIPSDCKHKQTVENVNEIRIRINKTSQIGMFNYTEEHSKWAVSKDPALPYLCFGDLNRQEDQFLRGGGLTCFKSANTWNYMYDWISDVEKC